MKVINLNLHISVELVNCLEGSVWMEGVRGMGREDIVISKSEEVEGLISRHESNETGRKKMGQAWVFMKFVPSTFLIF